MEWFQALILGIVQGLTEYLPISSSGHLTIGSYLFGIDGDSNLAFNIVVHVATVLSTVVILWREIYWLVQDLFRFKWNDGTKYIVNILISMIPVAVVGFCFKDVVEGFFSTEHVESLFGNGLLLVGICLMITAILLLFSYYSRPRIKENISPLHAFLIGCAQAIAVLPGLSRSGSTIATGLILGNKKEKMAQFSFLMVIPPILGEALLDVKDLFEESSDAVMSSISTGSLLIGFFAAFVVGCLACKWMVNIVKKGKLVYFALYCVAVALLAIVLPYVIR